MNQEAYNYLLTELAYEVSMKSDKPKGSVTFLNSMKEMFPTEFPRFLEILKQKVKDIPSETEGSETDKNLNDSDDDIDDEPNVGDHRIDGGKEGVNKEENYKKEEAKGSAAKTLKSSEPPRLEEPTKKPQSGSLPQPESQWSYTSCPLPDLLPNGTSSSNNGMYRANDPTYHHAGYNSTNNSGNTNNSTSSTSSTNNRNNTSTNYKTNTNNTSDAYNFSFPELYDPDFPKRFSSQNSTGNTLPKPAKPANEEPKVNTLENEQPVISLKDVFDGKNSASIQSNQPKRGLTLKQSLHSNEDYSPISPFFEQVSKSKPIQVSLDQYGVDLSNINSIQRKDFDKIAAFLTASFDHTADRRTLLGLDVECSEQEIKQVSGEILSRWSDIVLDKIRIARNKGFLAMQSDKKFETLADVYWASKEKIVAEQNMPLADEIGLPRSYTTEGVREWLIAVYRSKYRFYWTDARIRTVVQKVKTKYMSAQTAGITGRLNPSKVVKPPSYNRSGVQDKSRTLQEMMSQQNGGFKINSSNRVASSTNGGPVIYWVADTENALSSQQQMTTTTSAPTSQDAIAQLLTLMAATGSHDYAIRYNWRTIFEISSISASKPTV